VWYVVYLSPAHCSASLLQFAKEVLHIQET
jgi:hypothetical protein